jgi:rRNA processing protein Gar1
MRLLGLSRCASSAGRIVVESTFVPEENQNVFDRRGKSIGFVKEIIGRVDAPFVLISTQRNFGTGNLSGLEVYVEESVTNGKSKGDKGRSRRS